MVHCRNPSISPSRELPVLVTAFEPITRSENIIKVLAKANHSLDTHLSTLQRAQSTAFIALVEEQLGEALLYTLYIEKGNFY
jgi:hypothetical protein